MHFIYAPAPASAHAACRVFTPMELPWRLFLLVSAIAIATYHPTGASAQLVSGFYSGTCPQVESVVFAAVRNGQFFDSRLPASLLRLHFHDCFVNGCDASVLLDDTPAFQGEKNAVPNRNSLRGFRVIDQIKSQLEFQCPGVVSCADILAIAARDSVVVSGGPSYEVLLGRRDGLSASQSDANQFLPSPSSDVSTLVSKFEAVGLSAEDMVILSGAHTIGLAKCSNFNSRLFNFSNGQPDSTLDSSFLVSLQQVCQFGGSSSLVVLDSATPTRFDNGYYSNLQAGRGLLRSDQVLYSDGGFTQSMVDEFATNPGSFIDSFAQSMAKLQSISPLTGNDGEIRSNCHFTNS